MPRSVSLSRSNARRFAADLLGIAGDLAHDVVAGQRHARVEQQREQVQDAFDARRGVGHGRAGYGHARSARAAVPRPRRPFEQHRVVGRGPAHRHDVQAVLRRAASTMPRGATSTISWRASMPDVVEVGAERASLSPPTVGERDEHPAAGRDREGRDACGARCRGGARVDRRTTRASDAIGVPPQPGRGVEHGSDLDAAEAEPGSGADDAGSHGDDDRVGVDDAVRDRERAVDRDRFVVAAERMAARDRRVEQRP